MTTVPQSPSDKEWQECAERLAVELAIEAMMPGESLEVFYDRVKDSAHQITLVKTGTDNDGFPTFAMRPTASV
jgi:hypothetical protein